MLTKILFTKCEEDILAAKLTDAKTYEEWTELAERLDHLEKRHVWREAPASTLYDFTEVRGRLRTLRRVASGNDGLAMIVAVRSGLIRNLAGISDPRLFSYARLGTKVLIEEYLSEVTGLLDSICDTEFSNLSTTRKTEIFAEISQVYGRTALLFQGGSFFGLFHFGVARALFQQNLLPKIICGSSVGAFIAALVCTHTDKELESILQPDGLDLAAFANKSGTGNLARKITRMFKHGYLLDVSVLELFVRRNLGEVTFLEAYKLTNRVLCISVASTRANEVPKLLNYLTAPNVLIWSACCASAANLAITKYFDLLAKDTTGNSIHWSPSRIKWKEKSHDEEARQKLVELFNVNHFIVSDATPSVASSNRPSGFVGRVFTLIMLELQQRLNQLAYLGIIEQGWIRFFHSDSNPLVNLCVSPGLDTRDFFTVFSNPTHESLKYWFLKGEQATWPHIALLRSRMKIERCLDAISSRLKN